MHIMLKEAFRSGKDFICAKVRSRCPAEFAAEFEENGSELNNQFCGNQAVLLNECTKFKKDEGKDCYSYYNAFSILNQIMRKR